MAAAHAQLHHNRHVIQGNVTVYVLQELNADQIRAGMQISVANVLLVKLKRVF